jgi:hypothetical protein
METSEVLRPHERPEQVDDQQNGDDADDGDLMHGGQSLPQA